MLNANEGLDLLIQRLSVIENLLSKQQVQPATKEKETMSIHEVAELLGKSVDTIYSYTSTKRIPHSKPLGTLIFIRSEIMEWISTFKVKTIYEIETDADLHLIQLNSRKSA